MRRIVAAMAVGIGMLAGLGCAGKAEYVQKNKDGGIIALKVGADDAEATKLIEKHLGSNYVIVEKYDPKLRSPTGRDLMPAGKLDSMTTKDDVMHISYRKLPDSNFGGSTPSGLPPAPKDTGVVPVGGMATPTRPVSTAGPQTNSAGDPMTPPALFGDR